MRQPLGVAVLGAAILGLALPATSTAQPDRTTEIHSVQLADTTAQAAPADTSAPPPVNLSRRTRVSLGQDVDRLELGAAVVDGPFDVVGTLGYHRYIRQGGPFENWIHVEFTGGATKYLNEGTMSAGYFLRPLRTIHRTWPIQPILEVGTAGHISVQVAEIQGYSETAFHAHAYLKTHAIGGLEAHLTGKWGLVARGRFTVPEHHPFDYAQIALFFR